MINKTDKKEILNQLKALSLKREGKISKESILEELKDLGLNKEDIKTFFENRVSFILQVKPCKKKTRYTVSTIINIASDYEEKNLVEDITDLINDSKDLNYTLLTTKTENDNKKTVFFDCDFSFNTGLTRFDNEINEDDFIIIQNLCYRACEFLQFILDNLEEKSNDNVVYLNRRQHKK